MPGWHMPGCGFDMASLVIEEKVGLELAQEFALGQAAKKHRLIDADIPAHQGADGTFMGRGAARRWPTG